MGAAKMSTDPVGDLLGAEPSSRLDDRPRAMNPLGVIGWSQGLLTGR
jgi:hypothetical protein